VSNKEYAVFGSITLYNKRIVLGIQRALGVDPLLLMVAECSKDASGDFKEIVYHDTFCGAFADYYNRLIYKALFDNLTDWMSRKVSFEDALGYNEEIFTIMPDDTISINDMNEYGYISNGMFPMRKAVAIDVAKYCTIYLLHKDGTKSEVQRIEQIESFDGIFGIEEDVWNQWLFGRVTIGNYDEEDK